MDSQSKIPGGRNPDDEGIVAREIQLPAMQTILDEAAIAELLRELSPDHSIHAVRSEYVRYKPGVSCLVKFSVESSAGSSSIYARAHRPDQRGKTTKVSQESWCPGSFGFGAHVFEELSLVMFEFPNDHEMPVVRRIDDPVAQPELLQRLLPKRPELWNATIRGLRYKPERRHTARLENAEGAPVGIIKTCAGAEFAAAYANSRAFTSIGPLRVPTRIGRSRRHHILVYEWLEGRPVSGFVTELAAAEEVASRIGEAAAHMHSQEPRGANQYRSEVLANVVSDAAAAITVLSPELAEQVTALAVDLQSELARVSLNHQAIHGDFSMDQAVVLDDAIGIVDFDRAGCGDAARDLGQFAADCFLLSIRGELGQATVDVMTRGLATGYLAAGGQLEPQKFRLFESIALMHLAVEPFRLRHSGWLSHMTALLERAREQVSR